MDTNDPGEKNMGKINDILNRLPIFIFAFIVSFAGKIYEKLSVPVAATSLAVMIILYFFLILLRNFSKKTSSDIKKSETSDKVIEDKINALEYPQENIGKKDKDHSDYYKIMETILIFLTPLSSIISLYYAIPKNDMLYWIVSIAVFIAIILNYYLFQEIGKVSSHNNTIKTIILFLNALFCIALLVIVLMYSYATKINYIPSLKPETTPVPTIALVSTPSISPTSNTLVSPTPAQAITPVSTPSFVPSSTPIPNPSLIATTSLFNGNGKNTNINFRFDVRIVNGKEQLIIPPYDSSPWISISLADNLSQGYAKLSVDHNERLSPLLETAKKLGWGENLYISLQFSIRAINGNMHVVFKTNPYIMPEAAIDLISADIEWRTVKIPANIIKIDNITYDLIVTKYEINKPAELLIKDIRYNIEEISSARKNPSTNNFVFVILIIMLTAQILMSVLYCIRNYKNLGWIKRITKNPIPKDLDIDKPTKGDEES